MLPRYHVELFEDALFLKNYVYKSKTKEDIIKAFSEFKNLECCTGEHVFNDGSSKNLICLSGGIPVTARGNTYPDIPVKIWLKETHPYDPPLCYVSRTVIGLLKPSKYVDSSGTISLPYLSDWRTGNGNLYTLIHVMSGIFGEILQDSPSSSTSSRAPTTDQRYQGDRGGFDGRGRRGGDRGRGGRGRGRGRAYFLKSKVTIDYDTNNEHELQLKVGDIVTVLDKATGDKAWWKGELNGKVGLYPHNFTVAFRPEEPRPSTPSHRGGFEADFDHHCRVTDDGWQNRGRGQGRGGRGGRGGCGGCDCRGDYRGARGSGGHSGGGGYRGRGGYGGHRGGYRGQGQKRDASTSHHHTNPANKGNRRTPNAPAGEETECSVCQDNPVNAVFYKCGHTSCCLECANYLRQKSLKCPICRAKIDDVIQTFKT